MIIAALFLIFILLLLGTLFLQRIRRFETNASNEVNIYAEHMRGLETDRDRGLVADDEFESMRAEIGRRMIKAAQHQPSKNLKYDNHKSWVLPFIIVLAFLLGTLIYSQLGAPGQPDLPIADRYAQSEYLRANRKSQLEAEEIAPNNMVDQDPTYVSLVEDLRTALKLRPNDLTGLELLAKSESRLGNYANAYAVQKNILNLKKENATSDEWYTYSELLIMAADGYISPMAEEALKQALGRNPENKLALFRMGVYFDQIGRPDRTFSIWRKLLETGPENAPYIPLIRGAIVDLALVAGVDYQPTEPKGPTTKDVESALALTTEEQEVMITGMVTGLASRLEADGGPSSDWARLIYSYAVLGNKIEANNTLTKALLLFAEQQSDLEILHQAAISAGIVK